MKDIRRLLTFYDKLLIVSLSIISLIFIILPLVSKPTGEGNKLESTIIIRSACQIEHQIPLAETYGETPVIVEVEGPVGISVIEAHQGRVRMKKAPEKDPEKICEKTGWIAQPGSVIICVPNRITIYIESRQTDIDGVSW